MKYERKIEKEIMCPIEYGLEMFGGKWKSRILCVLSAGEATRYSALKRELSDITDAVLATMLKELATDRLVSRRQYDEIPPRVEYALTERGTSVLPILQSICVWSRLQTADELDKKLPPCKTCSQL